MAACPWGVNNIGFLSTSLAIDLKIFVLAVIFRGYSYHFL
jgi:hypothetical protein